MPLETLDRTPPPFFKQGPSALSQLVLLSALALFLMVADARFHLVQPLRAAIATVLYPAQWLALQPVQAAREFGGYLTDLKTARKTEEAVRRKLVEQSQRAGQVEQLLLENARLRGLLALRERIQVPSQAAQVLYDATDPYSRRVVIDKGQLQDIAPGSPVLDGEGVLGQVTQVYPFVSEVTLLIDRDQVIPVVNTRTGTRGVAFGDPTAQGGLLELRYMPAGEDVKEGDLLSTSGIDGVYPPGLPVARVVSVDRQGDSSFARILCQPLAQLQGARHVMVLTPMAQVAPPPIAAAPAAPPAAAAQPVTKADGKPAAKAAGKSGAASAARPANRRSAP
ncbi:MAG TPA: rod shape-determining protein MreC [Ottowia sp.]|nr:rod shape-determining protein MreC [Pseudomonadota bacterium]MBS0414808.1 rod shape-determining protein MreC [Pseudomonadota bacterium]HMN57034.1 rod shape-determining protein MreC [Ottowia sp.]